MYIPEYYQMPDQAEQLAFMHQYPFALLVGIEGETPIATHLPFVIETAEDTGQIFLYSHLAKANPHAHLLAGSNALVVFQEPHAYISPRFYDKQMNVPTWNYLAVHAYGQPQILDGEAAWQVLEKMILSFESPYKNQWDGLPQAYKQGLFKEIVAFRIPIEKIEAKKKLSQNKTDAERSRIAEALAQSPISTEKDLANYMK